MFKLGYHGNDLKPVQDKLGVVQDGIFGPKTLEATISYQKVHGLEVDGIIGPKTLKSMNIDIHQNEGLIIPFALQTETKMRVRGQYRDGMKGAIVHFTAGNFGKLSEAVSTIEWGAKQGYAYLCISSGGDLLQAHDVLQWGYHCGDSRWPGLGSGLSDQLIGIEICCAGRVERNGDHFKSWFGKEIEKKDVRSSSDHDYQGEPGFYHKYTPNQELTLIKTLFWLKKNIPSFNFDYVLGHDEVSPGRKNDPGASLSMPMPEFREFLKEHYEKAD